MADGDLRSIARPPILLMLRAQRCWATRDTKGRLLTAALSSAQMVVGAMARGKQRAETKGEIKIQVGLRRAARPTSRPSRGPRFRSRHSRPTRAEGARNINGIQVLQRYMLVVYIT